MQFTRFKYYILAVISLLAVSSCQKVIDLKLENAAVQLVIEGNVSNQRGIQTITISQSVPFSNTNTFPPVSGAVVTVNDGKGTVYAFTESNIKGTYTNSVLTGKSGYTYTLTVQVNGQTYTGSSTMPTPVFYGPLTYTNDAFNANREVMVVNFQDPLNVPNQYRFIMYVNSVQVKTIFDSNDTFTDGGNVDIDLYEGDIPVIKGDTVLVESQGIDKNIFNYWFSLSQQQDNGAGGGTSPSNPPSNLSNNALGYFSAHTDVKQAILIR